MAIMLCVSNRVNKYDIYHFQIKMDYMISFFALDD